MGAALLVKEDGDLLERIRCDDADAYRLLVEKHVDGAYGLAFRFLNNAADAEDVVQDAFVKTWLGRHRWEGGRAKFSTWLYRVIVNRCIDLKRLPRSDWIEDVDEPSDGGEDTESGLNRREVYGKLEDALQRLPDQQRIAVVLSYYEDLGNAEIAEVMGTTIAAVESLLKRSRQKLHQMLRRSEREIRTCF